MVTKGVFVAVVLVAIATAVGIAAKKPTAPVIPSPSATPNVAGENISIQANLPPLVLPAASSFPTSASSHLQLNTAASITPSPTPTPTPSPLPTESQDGNWSVTDSGKDSNPRTAGISYESEDGNSKSNVSVTQSVGGGGSSEQHLDLSVTVNGDTREIKD